MNVFITGASGNLGGAVVEQFEREKWNVLATIPRAVGHRLPSTVETYEADLEDETSARQAVQKAITNVGQLDAAVLLVGGFAMGGIVEGTTASFRKMMSLNFETALHVVRPIFEQMLQQPGGGRIVMVGARPALRAEDGKSMVDYALSKSLIFKLAEILNAEGADHNIVTTVVVPSTIDTAANRASMPQADFSKWVPPASIADAIFFACSAAGSSLREPVLKLYGRS